jgi:hypothetical protein
MRQVRIYIALCAVAAVALLIVPRFHAADSLPNQIADDAFWKLIENSSESGGAFQSENFLSNETGFEAVIPTLKQKTKPGGVYMGVGPEQNFTYIAAIHPKIAFIIDIRHQNMLEHMIYKSLFESSANRSEFVSKLFSRKRAADLNDKAPVDEVFDVYLAQPVDNDAFKKNLQDIKDLLVKKHKFALTTEDLDDIEHVYTVFRDFGPEINYNSGSPRGGYGRGRFGGGMPNYVDLMTTTDLQGEERSFLANEENYRTIRDLEVKNLIIPLTGDFGGPKALRAVAQYAKDHNAIITAFYLSNVEQYLFQGNGNQNGGWKNFYQNCGALPLDSTSMFIRSVGGMGRMYGGAGGYGGRGFGGMRAPNVLSAMQETLAAVRSGRILSYYDILSMSK